MTGSTTGFTSVATCSVATTSWTLFSTATAAAVEVITTNSDSIANTFSGEFRDGFIWFFLC